MSPPPYTTILLCPLHTGFTESTGLTFLHQRQCPQHHIPLFYCMHCVLHLTVYCIHWFDLFAPKTMSPQPYTTIPLCTAYCVLCTASTVLTFLYQRQCPHHHIPLFHCILHPLHTVSTVYCVHSVTAATESTGLTFLHQRQCPYHHIPLFHCINCILHTASTGLTFLYQRQSPHHHIPLFYCIHLYCIHCVLHPLHLLV